MASFAIGGGNGSDGDGNEERGRADGSRRAGQEVAAAPLPSLAHLAAAAAVAAGETPESITEKDFPVGALAADLVAQRLALFGIGKRVAFKGLQSEKGRKMNGRTGHILGFHEATGRFEVEAEVSLPGDKWDYRIKPANLEPVPAREPSLAGLQALVNVAEDGSRINIRGVFPAAAPGAQLRVTGAIALVGKGSETTVLNFALDVSSKTTGALLHLANFTVNGPITVAGGDIRRVWLQNVNIRYYGHGGKDALILNRVGNDCREVLVEGCTVEGGSDGVMINAENCRLLRCRIRGAESRGIFSNPHYVIEDSTVQGCGGYGMKTRGGCTRIGHNDIQPGPWDTLSGGYGGGFFR